MDKSVEINNSMSNHNIELLHKIEAELIAEDAEFRKKGEELVAHTDVLSLPWVSLANRKELPNIPDIYFVLEDNRVIYIGLSAVSILRRWWTHPKLQEIGERKGEIKIAWLECRAVLLLPIIESALIDRFGKPELNQK